jgi:hypothetical protein
VHVAEDPDLQVMATITPARGIAPAHFLRYRPGSGALDYLELFIHPKLMNLLTQEGSEFALYSAGSAV